MTTERLDTESNTLPADSSPTSETDANREIAGGLKSGDAAGPSGSLPPPPAPKSVLPRARAAAVEALRKAACVSAGQLRKRGKGRIRTLDQVRARFAWLQAQLECGAIDTKVGAIMVQALNGLASVIGAMNDLEFEARLVAIEARLEGRKRGNDA